MKNNVSLSSTVIHTNSETPKQTKTWQTKANKKTYDSVLEVATSLGLRPEDKGLSWKIRKYEDKLTGEVVFKLKVCA